ncbi:MAG: hypothetical protein K940chlam1_00649 [Candidatus Anoxychlamydiales bacterium]|nr:hypothetical protein [Candidatus Anoxychlamydiales bacterium]NGX36165.1 hypothetical protein [Candidatus Anoxychlamydiales bacterium]
MNIANIDFTVTYTMVFLVAGFFVFIGLTIISKYVKLWFQAYVSGIPIPFFNIIGMSFRKIPPNLIVNARIIAFKAGLKEITTSDLETHYLAGGKVSDIVKAMIAADKANINLDWKQATAIDLAGRDLFEAVKTSVHPKVIDCPPNGEYISAVAGNGIELKCRARVTVRTNISQLVGGATEETIIARVGEGIVSTIGSAKNHQIVLESPHNISKTVLATGLDAGTSYEILSIDIADITIGDNVGARLEVEGAEANVKVARAKAEERRAMAVALEQENTAKIRDAESKLPLAMAKAFENGNLGILDYLKMKNIQADTTMRDFIAKTKK